MIVDSSEQRKQSPIGDTGSGNDVGDIGDIFNYHFIRFYHPLLGCIPWLSSQATTNL
jgi:hypothetical protein